MTPLSAPLMWETMFAAQRAYWDMWLSPMTTARPASTQLTVVPMTQSNGADRANGTDRVEDTAERVIDFGEEVLEVSKRKVLGAVTKVRRLTHHVPVEKRVELIDEIVVIERLPGVDDPINDEALTAREFFLADVREIAVVEKHAKLKGRVILKRQRSGRVETVHDTVRHTEVKFDQPDRLVVKAK
jgi:Domain of unknown function (DUF2382)